MRALIATALLLLAACRVGEPLPKLMTVPKFEMRDQDAQPTTDAILRGKIGIVSFMFTSCPDVCPLLTAKLAGVRTKLLAQRSSLRFVSISVDPITDTPEALKRYAKQHGADYPDWRFLTGPSDKLRSVVVDGFKQSLSVTPTPPGQAPSPASILHGSHFVLVDRKGTIRGYYPSDEPGTLKLARDARLLIREKP
jgi:protein SCO1/2